MGQRLPSNVTDEVYLDDSTVRGIEAIVDRTVDDRIVLDRTCCYPQGGGQPADRGTLSNGEHEWQIVDVRKKDTIYHHLDGPEPPAEGTTVTVELDWDRRYAHMRYHTAQHLFSAGLLDLFDAPTTGNQLYDDRARIDCAYDRLSDTDLADLEAWVNEAVEEERPVTWDEFDRAVAEEELDPERTRIHLLPDSITEVRIVEIEGYDRTACAGTHVENTREIGEVAVAGRETMGSDEERVRFELR